MQSQTGRRERWLSGLIHLNTSQQYTCSDNITGGNKQLNGSCKPAPAVIPVDRVWKGPVLGHDPRALEVMRTPTRPHNAAAFIRSWVHGLVVSSNGRVLVLVKGGWNQPPVGPLIQNRFFFSLVTSASCQIKVGPLVSSAMVGWFGGSFPPPPGSKSPPASRHKIQRYPLLSPLKNLPACLDPQCRICLPSWQQSRAGNFSCLRSHLPVITKGAPSMR